MNSKTSENGGRISVIPKEITNQVTNTLAKGHAYGFCPIKSSIDPSGLSFVFHGGCLWDDYTCDSRSYNFFRVFHPHLKHFRDLPPLQNTGQRYRHSLTFRLKEKDPNNNESSDPIQQLILFGGVVEPGFTKDSFRFDMLHQSEKWESLTHWENHDLLPVLGFHTALYHSLSDRMFIFGGKNANGRRNQVLVCSFEEEKWRILGSPVNEVEFSWPSNRAGHTMCWINANQFLVFGGMNSNNRDLNESWVYDVRTGKWEHWVDSLEGYSMELFSKKKEKKGNIPCPRASHCACVVGKYLYVHGGASVKDNEEEEHFQSEYIVHNDFFRLDLETRRWESLNLVVFTPEKPIFSFKKRKKRTFQYYEEGEEEEEIEEEEDGDKVVSEIVPNPAYIRLLCPFYHGNEVRIIGIGGLAEDMEGNLVSTNRIFEFRIQSEGRTRRNSGRGSSSPYSFFGSCGSPTSSRSMMMEFESRNNMMFSTTGMRERARRKIYWFNEGYGTSLFRVHLSDRQLFSDFIDMVVVVLDGNDEIENEANNLMSLEGLDFEEEEEDQQQQQQQQLFEAKKRKRGEVRENFDTPQMLDEEDETFPDEHEIENRKKRRIGDN